MAVYDRVPGMDSEYNLIPEVRRSLAESPENAAAIGGQLTEQVSDEVAQAIAEDGTIKQAAIDAMSDPAVIAALKFYRGELKNADDMFTLPVGSYTVGGLGSSNPNLPEIRYGTLIIPSSSGPRNIMFITNDLGDTRNGVKYYVLGSNNSGSFVGQKWRDISTNARGVPNNHAIDVWATHPGYNGSYAIANSKVEAANSKNPTAFGYVLDHETQVNGGTRQFASATHVADQGLYHRAEASTASGEMTLWKRIMDEKMSPALNRHSLLYSEMAELYGGRIYTGSAVPVALTFDDYPRDFRDRILPLLVARGLSATIGLSSKMYDSTSTVIYAGATGTTWSEIDSWPDLISIANHSATHGSAEDRLGIFKEIVYGLRDLRAALPNKPIYTFIQPSVTYDAGFDNGNSLESYAGTIAGHLQLGHHAYVTGVRRGKNMATSCVMDGNPPIQGLVRNWVDSSNGITIAKDRITAARAKKHGLIVAAHADRFDKVGSATMAEITSFLDWLKAEQDAGRIRVMKLEEFAIAQYGGPGSYVDNSVGTRVMVHDPVSNSEILLTGDTKLRSVPLPQGVTGSAFLRRVGNSVTLFFRDVTTPTTDSVIYEFLQGFTPDYQPRYDMIGRTGGRIPVYFTVAGNKVAQNGSQTGTLYASITFNTNDAWPVSLPGTPV